MRCALALLSTLLAIGSQAIEPGFYSALDDRAKVLEVFQVSTNADRELRFHADLRCDLGLGVVRDGARTPLYLSREEAEPFLKRERHKAFLVVWCEKTIMWSDKKETLIAEVRTFVTRLSYERVLMLGAHGAGIHVIADLTASEAEPDGAANRSQPIRVETNPTSAAAGSDR